MPSIHDAIVVGASVSGSMAARALASKGHSVALVEEHEKTGKMGKCTAIVSKKGLDSLGVDYSRAKLNDVKGARIFSGKEELAIKTSTVQAVVMNRFLFDDACVSSAVDKGAELFTGLKLTSIKQNGAVESTCVNTISNGSCCTTTQSTQGGKTFSSKALIGADGVWSGVASAGNFPKIPMSQHVVAFEREVSGVTCEKDAAYVILEKEFTDFFAWVVPCSESVARIGFATRNFHGFNKAKEALLKHPAIGELAKGKTEREFSHLIPLKARKQTQKQNILLVGDAAGQVKSTTGGGIVYGGNCAKIAGAETAKFLEGGSLGYEKAWRMEYGNYLRMHSIARSFLNTFGGPSFLKAFRLLGGRAMLENFGDMDYFIKKK